MSQSKDDTDGKPGRKGKPKLMLIAAALALLTGGGGFYAVYSGLLELPFIDGSAGKSLAATGGHGGELGGGKIISRLQGIPVLNPRAAVIAPERLPVSRLVTITERGMAVRTGQSDCLFAIIYALGIR